MEVLKQVLGIDVFVKELVVTLGRMVHHEHFIRPCFFRNKKGFKSCLGVLPDKKQRSDM
jgi:hypothetical protein